MQKPSLRARASSLDSLSARLMWPMLAAVLLMEFLVFAPDIARERSRWLEERVEAAHIAGLSVAAAPKGTVDMATLKELLRLSGTKAIRLRDQGRTIVLLDGIGGRKVEAVIDLREEYNLNHLREALILLVKRSNRLVEIVADSPFVPQTEVRLVVEEGVLGAHLRRFAGRLFWVSMLIACTTGLLLYLALLAFLVRPMRRITGSIVAFRSDPEHAEPLKAEQVSLLNDDEMAHAGRELSAMQRELRTALWRNARLAALGTTLAKVSHDLRGILTPALLSAERLQLHADPAVRQAGETLVDSVDRATDLVRGMLDFAREGPAAPSLETVSIAALLAQAAASITASGMGLRVDCAIDEELMVAADRKQLMRVLINLMRNAVEAGATRIVASAAAAMGRVTLDIADNGPGLPEAIRADLFRPFVTSTRRGGTGLGLAIARDLMRAHGGEIVLGSTGPEGTLFRLTLPGPEHAPAGKPPSLATTA